MSTIRWSDPRNGVEVHALRPLRFDDGVEVELVEPDGRLVSCAGCRYCGAEGKTAGMMVRGEFMDWWERRNGATAAPEAAGGAQTGAELPADVSGEKTAQIAGNLEQGN